MEWNNWRVFSIGFLVGFLMTFAIQEAYGHDTHLSNQVVVPGSYNGKQLRTTDGKCWKVVKADHGDLTTYTRLHIEEVTCSDTLSKTANTTI